MKISRLFLKDDYVGEKNYIKTQTKYEVARTILYFAISLSLFIGGWVTTGERTNLLTIVAILGCLPASKSMVDMIMYLRYRSCSEEAASQIEKHVGSLDALYDLVFTSYQKNFVVSHLVVKGNTICGYSENASFSEQEFNKHLDGILKTDNFKDTSIKIFTDIKKYCNRLDQLVELEADECNTSGIISTIKHVVLQSILGEIKCNQ